MGKKVCAAQQQQLVKSTQKLSSNNGIQNIKSCTNCSDAI